MFGKMKIQSYRMFGIRVWYTHCERCGSTGLRLPSWHEAMVRAYQHTVECPRWDMVGLVRRHKEAR